MENIKQHESLMQPKPVKRKSLLTLLAVVLAILSGCGDGTVPSLQEAKEYVVELVTETGQRIVERARSLAEALKLVWGKVFYKWEGNVKVDPKDPVRGWLQGTYHLVIVIPSEDGRKNKIRVQLTNPTMRRERVDSPFEVDPSNFPSNFAAKLEE